MLSDGKIIDIADDFESQYMHGGVTFDEFDSLGFARAIEREATAQLIDQIKEDEALIRRALDVLGMWHMGACPAVTTTKTMQAIRQRLETKK